jgi:hypothetical protein
VLVAAVLAAGVLLVGAYVALGGGDYAPAPVADPCAPREWRDPEGTTRVAEQIALSTLDGAACELGVSREELTLSLASDARFAEFQAARGLDDDRVEDALRRGLLRAVDDADRAGALNSVEEFLLRQAAERVPLTQLIALVRDGRLDWVPGLFG